MDPLLHLVALVGDVVTATASTVPDASGDGMNPTGEAEELARLLRLALGIAVGLVIALLVLALPARAWWRRRRDDPGDAPPTRPPGAGGGAGAPD